MLNLHEYLEFLERPEFNHVTGVQCPFWCYVLEADLLAVCRVFARGHDSTILTVQETLVQRCGG